MGMASRHDAIGGTGRTSAPLVFVGYGITAKEHEYDDYAGLDVMGKVVVLIRKEPQQNNPHSAFDGTNASRHAPFMSKLANAYEHGAAAVILVNDGWGLHETMVAAEKSFDDGLTKLAEIQKTFQEKASSDAEAISKYRAEVTQVAERVQSAGKQLAAADFDRLVGFREAGGESSHR